MYNRYIDILLTAKKLGWRNVFFVFKYRVQLALGIKKRKLPVSTFESQDDFFCASDINYSGLFCLSDVAKVELFEKADQIISGNLIYYSYHVMNVGFPPQWFTNPFNGKSIPDAQKHWTEIKAFGEVGDIKSIWEASRFDWVYTLSRAYVYSNDSKYLKALNSLLKYWHESNPLNVGPNWYCGQEASIRVFALLNCWQYLEKDSSSSKFLFESIEKHVERIFANIGYALAQDNNHGTSEAAGLYIGGIFLSKYSEDNQKISRYKKISNKGKAYLESTVKKLFDDDGTFSQYSVNYHRVALDTMCFAEIWRSKYELEPFNEMFYKKAKVASVWLRNFINPLTGERLNIGSNDGAMLLRSHSCDYKDFRPSCQLASALFEEKLFFDKEGAWNEVFHFFRLDISCLEVVPNKKVSQIIDNNYLLMASQKAWAFMRLPKFKHRPKQMDIFHFDFSLNGKNLLCDAGTYTYNGKGLNTPRNFKSIESHNSISFGNEPMPKLSRFLSGSWLSVESFSEVIKQDDGFYKTQSHYRDYLNNLHKRTIVWNNQIWKIIDQVLPVNKSSHVTVGFNLNTNNAILSNDKKNIFLPLEKVELNFSNEVMLCKRPVSDYYMEFHDVFHISSTICADSTFTTEIKFIE